MLATVGGTVGRQIINTGGPARTRYRAIRMAFIAAIVAVCVIVVVAFLRTEQRHTHVVPGGYRQPAGAAARP